MTNDKEQAISLPDNFRQPIKITGRETPATVYADGKAIAKIKKGGSATFVVQDPKWWQFWKKPAWIKQR